MIQPLSLSNHFLIAMPGLEDPNFHHTVTYICDHNNDGAIGLVINRPTDIQLSDLAEHLNMTVDDVDLAAIPIYQGGPVQMDRGFVLHTPLGNWENTLKVTDDIGLTMSQDIIRAIVAGRGPNRFLIALGYAGWGNGQLETEIAANAWLSDTAEPDIVFNMPDEQRWNAAAQHLGVQLDRLSSDIGHG